MLFVRLPRNLRIFCFQKRCHWIIFKVPWFELSPCKVTPKDVWSVNFNTKKKRVFKKYTVCVKQTCRVALEVWLNKLFKELTLIYRQFEVYIDLIHLRLLWQLVIGIWAYGTHFNS